VVPAAQVQSGGGLPPPNPPMTDTLPAAPAVGLVVRHDGAHWVDEINRNWDPATPYTLPDQDVFVVDADARSVLRAVAGVGTLDFNLAVNPATQRLWVANTDARNSVRFEPNQRGQF